MKYALYIVALLVGFGLCALLFKGCGNKAVQVLTDSLQHYEDVQQEIVTQTNTVKKANDSLMVSFHSKEVVYKNKIDSQTHVIAVLKGQFKVAKDSISKNFADLKRDYDNKDTAALRQAYNELGSQLSDANNLLFNLSRERDLADSTRDNKIADDRTIIESLQSQVKQLGNLLDSCNTNSASAIKAGEKAARKAKARGLLAKIAATIAAISTLAFLVK